MHKAASEFAKDTLQTGKRDVMVQASQELLKAVTRLMVIADMVDVSKLLKASSRVRNAAFWFKHGNDIIMTSSRHQHDITVPADHFAD